MLASTEMGFLRTQWVKTWAVKDRESLDLGTGVKIHAGCENKIRRKIF